MGFIIRRILYIFCTRYTIWKCKFTLSFYTGFFKIMSLFIKLFFICTPLIKKCKRIKLAVFILLCFIIAFSFYNRNQYFEPSEKALPALVVNERMLFLNSYILSISPPAMRNSYSLLAHMQEAPKNTVIDWLTSSFFKSKIRGRANQKEDMI